MSSETKKIDIPFNRVEGDLEVKVDVTDDTITDAWSCGTMYRGFEAMMTGRGPLDGLVITPRICGICSLTHLNAAAVALDRIAQVTLPDNAIRLRNVALMAETIQSDLRQAVLMYMADFTNHKAYQKHPLFKEAVARYQMLSGSSVVEVIRKTKRLIEIIAIIGGQWPHTSFMVPGGVTSIPYVPKLMQSRLIFNRFLEWYEKKVLGCTIARWQAVTTRKELAQWFEERPEHRDSEVGFFIRFAEKAGLDTYGRGNDHFLCFGNFPLPKDTAVTPRVPGTDQLTTPGFFRGTEYLALDAANIKEDITCSWFEQKPVVSHPFDSVTRPYASGNMGKPYSWVKAPRYDGLPAETGPLAEAVMDRVPLFLDLIRNTGATALVRQLARITRPARLLPDMGTWIDELLAHHADPFYTPVKTIPDGQGAGMIQAARGALGHWVTIENSKISNYQVITPTAWNGSPRDGQNQPGPWESALKGTPVKDPDNPVEAGHVIRSFDPCMVCAVHIVKNEK
ncbi:nickel-dependent hydrogenase large subunit [Desulfotignum balticum]|jgi:hydrogenase large subunit|uniref:nickel-dependent hydrogenase large subunit n=1 Tax=Desulfotignum balticum TaxID=115781 RepID=UPI00040BF042|nr:nickel-dependent hydrogenase large subunit [Desulfotignum balticum]